MDRRQRIILSILFGVITGFVCAILFACLLRCFIRYINRTPILKGPVVLSPKIAPKSLQSALATENHLLGSSPNGTYYRTVLDNGLTIAVKRLDPFSNLQTNYNGPPLKDVHTKRKIQQELQLLASLRHRNLMSLLVRESDNRFSLVYDYVPTGSLRDAMNKVRENQLRFNWDARLRIAVGIVKGLQYLHFRCLAASENDLQKADAAAKEIEEAGGPVDLSVDLDKLQGRWKLIYSSAFSSRTLGGSRPGPPTGRLLPITLGQVFQRIDILSKDFDNIVELELGAPWPLPPVEVTATLAHKFELTGSSSVKIIFEKTTVKTTGNLSQIPPLEIPQLPEALRPSTNRGSGDFDVTYLDSDVRITRGDRGELRVFVIS